MTMIPMHPTVVPSLSKAAEDARKVGLGWFRHPNHEHRLLPAHGGMYDHFCWHGVRLTERCRDCHDDIQHLDAQELASVLVPAQRGLHRD